MKIGILIMVLVLCIPLFLNAQTYTEIFAGGWGYGEAASKAVFADLDNDGLLDMILAKSYDYFHHYEQDATGSTDFNLITEELLGVCWDYYVTLCLTDLNNNNLIDLIIGYGAGELIYYEQSTAGSPDFTLITETLSTIDVGRASAPFVIDIDGNGLLDLIVGESDGNLNHFEQVAAGSTDFTLITENFNGINVGLYSVPFIADIDGDGLLDMLVGELDGNINHYEQDAIGSSTFNLESSDFNDIDVGSYSTPILTDFNNDGLLDLVSGEWDGNLNHYQQDAVGSNVFSLVSERFYSPDGIDVGSHSAPCFTDLDDDGFLDMIVGEQDSHLYHYEQNNGGSTEFTLITEDFNSIHVGGDPTPRFTDLDNDGLLDLIVGEAGGNLNYYEQNAEGSTDFTLMTENFNGIDVGRWSVPCFIDLDNNGLLDMFVGEYEGNLYHYEQNTEGSTEFTLKTDRFNGIDLGNGASPCFTDLDGDGLLDLIIGEQNGNLNHYEQNALNSTEFTFITNNFSGIYAESHPNPVFVDINKDGLEDFLVGENRGGIRFFQRDDDTGINDKSVRGLSKSSFRLYNNHPNPFNPSTTIQFQLPRSAYVTLKIYSLLGREIETLFEGQKAMGEYRITWVANDLHSGIYLVHFKADEFVKTKKILLQK